MRIDEKLVANVINRYCEVGSVEALKRFNNSEREKIYNIASVYYGLIFRNKIYKTNRER